MWVSGPSVMAGYHNQPEATAAALRDGWYRTGDLARRDEAGYFTITGRIKELIIRGGENIHPGRGRGGDPARPRRRRRGGRGQAARVLGEVPVAYLVPGPEGIDPEQVFAACREQLSYFKVPEELYEIARVPRTASGKVTRLALLHRPARLLGASSGYFEHLYSLEWIPLPSVPVAPAELAGPRRWAVVGPDAATLAAALAATGAEADAHAELAGLLQAVAAGAPRPDAVILRHDAPLPAESAKPEALTAPSPAGLAARAAGRKANSAPSAAAGLAAQTHQRVRHLAAHLDQWLDAGHDDVPLLLLTRDAVIVDGDEAAPDLGAAPLWGWLRGRQQAGRFLLADHDGASDLAKALPQLLSGGPEQAALRRNVLLTPRLTRATASRTDGTLLDPRGTVLITGAEGAQAATIARHLGTVHRARHFLLVSPRGDADQTAADLGAELSRLGGTVTVAANGGTRAAFEALISRATPALTAAVFTVGEPDLADGGQATGPAAVGRVTQPAAGGQATQPAVGGRVTEPAAGGRVTEPAAGGRVTVAAAFALHEALAKAPTATLLLISSGAGQLGSAAEPDEAATAAFLDTLAQHRRGRDCLVRHCRWAAGATPTGPAAPPSR